MATIHSVLHFCGAAWQPWLAKSNLQILERIQNRALSCLTGQLADTPLECLRNEAALTSFATTVRRNCLIAWEKSSRLPPDNPRRSLFASPVKHRWKNRNSFSCMGKAECEEVGLDEIPRELFQKWHLPPWKWDTSPLWSVRTSLVCGSSKKNSVVEILADAIRSINDAGTLELTIYTDGSAVGGIAFGGSTAIDDRRSSRRLLRRTPRSSTPRFCIKEGQSLDLLVRDRCRCPSVGHGFPRSERTCGYVNDMHGQPGCVKCAERFREDR